LSGDEKAGFSPKAAYIFKKQLEEADFLVINRIDELRPSEVDSLQALLEDEVPGTPILRLSAKTGEGFDALLETLDQQGIFGRKILELDYDIYAEGEAELGWLNSSLRATSATAFALDDLLVGIVERLRKALASADAETAHLKAIGLWEGFYGVANLTSGDAKPELSLPSNCHTKGADIVVNARVAIDPESLTRLVESSVRAACDAVDATPEFRQTQSFRPGRPVPTHRYAEAFTG
jgi:G3E family GTPase